MNYYTAPMEGLTDRIWRQAHQRWFGAPGAPARYYAPFISPPENRVLIKKKMAELDPAANPGAPVIPQLLAKDGALAAWMIGELRMNRPPALSAANGRSAGNSCSVTGRRHSSRTTTMPTNETALRANTRVGPDSETNAPAIAGPIALAPFMLMLPSAAAAGICSRGTRSG